MQLINKYDKTNWFLLCVIVNFSKYTQFVTLKEIKGIEFNNAFRKMLDQPGQYKLDKKLLLLKDLLEL